MEDRLSISDLFAYAPFGVMLYTENNEIKPLLLKPFEDTSYATIRRISPTDKLILWNSSYLVKEIWHNGKKLTPLREATKMYAHKKDPNNNRIFDQYLLVDKLNEFKVDYRGLIARGLAIDCTTLEVNPYAKRYWHEVTEEEMNRLIAEKRTWGYVSERYLPPDWCTYPDPFHPSLGCWSLTGEQRTIVSKSYCENCVLYRQPNERKTNDNHDNSKNIQ